MLLQSAQAELASLREFAAKTATLSATMAELEGKLGEVDLDAAEATIVDLSAQLEQALLNSQNADASAISNAEMDKEVDKLTQMAMMFCQNQNPLT